ncbi:MAG: hypothetical protein HY914_06490 [Desulfomonile tiedjei]|nr:hypothetical protein [Desulfomonile tiedjei]
MAEWKLPPKAKIYEALGAIGDGRVTIVEPGQAQVASSDGSKTYLVEWSEDLRQITSNDNASYWQGYTGYPIVAVLMQLGRLDFSKDAAALLSGIPWKQLNRRFRNDYAKAIATVLDDLEAKGTPRETITAEVDRIVVQLEGLRLEKLPRRKRPPKEAK